MLSIETQKKLGIIRDFSALTTFQDKNAPSIIVASDWEGPWVLGDPLAQVMSSKVSDTLYADGYAAYNWAIQEKGLNPELAQEGTDTGFPLLYFLAMGINKKVLIEAARKSRLVDGAHELSDLVRSNGILLAITSAPTFMYEDLLKSVQLHGFIGTEFPLDRLKSILIKENRWDLEIGMVQEFLDEYNIRRFDATSNLEQWIWNDFFEGKLGLFFKNPYEMKLQNSNKTILGQYLESQAIVGDHTKSVLAEAAFKNNSGEDTITITMGDGPNDAKMLSRQGRFSIAFNASSSAVKAASIGVISPDLSPVIDIVEFVLRYPEANIDDIISEIGIIQARREKSEEVIIHKAGLNTPEKIIDSHRRQKRINRDPISTF